MRARLPWCGSLSAQVWLALLRLVLGVAVVMLPAALTGCALARPPRADAADHPQVVYVDRAVAVACLDARAMPAAAHSAIPANHAVRQPPWAFAVRR